jgi:hypothetical protein
VSSAVASNARAHRADHEHRCESERKKQTVRNSGWRNPAHQEATAGAHNQQDRGERDPGNEERASHGIQGISGTAAAGL